MSLPQTKKTHRCATTYLRLRLLRRLLERVSELVGRLHLHELALSGELLELVRQHLLEVVGELVVRLNVLGDGLYGRSGALLEGGDRRLDHLDVRRVAEACTCIAS